MPVYNFKCNGCDNFSSVFLKIEEFDNIKNSSICEKCGDKISRTFQKTNMMPSVDRSSAEIMEDLKLEVKEMAKKIRNGDLELSANIYGDEINSLKNR